MSVTKPKRPRKSSNWLDQLGREPAGEERERQRIPLAPVYALLIVLIVGSVVVSLIWDDVPVVDRFGAGLATESLGILLTVVFVRRFLEQNERSRRLRASIGALRKARRALAELTDAWATLIKGALPGRPDTLPGLRELCTPDQSDVLLSLDTTARTPGEPSELWLSWASRRLRAAQSALDTIIGTYGGTLDPEYVEALDSIVDDPFTRLVEELADTRTDGQKWRVSLNTARAVRFTHFERLLQTIKLHNRLAAEAAVVRAKGIGPRSETLGVELSPDHDLRLETRLDESWWKRRPTPGSLRAAK